MRRSDRSCSLDVFRATMPVIPAANSISLAMRHFCGGASGQAITPGNADESLLFQHIASGEMPKEEGVHKDPLLKEEIELFRTWIDTGAHWPEGRVLDLFERTTPRRAGRDWWSLKAVHASPIPSLPGAATANPIDAFISLHLRERGLVPAPKADPRTLLRRLSFDLIGLPPSPLELDEFLADASPNAWEHLVDRLLASPHYGERWARHWLDIARFAETNGYERVRRSLARGSIEIGSSMLSIMTCRLIVLFESKSPAMKFQTATSRR